MEDIAIAAAIPNMTVLAPCDPEEMRLATTWCAKESNGPVYMRLGKAGEPNLTADAIDEFEVGKIRYIKKGSDIALISYGITVLDVLDMAKRLELGGKSVSVISCHTIKPLDIEGIKKMLNEHNHVIVMEEHVPHGGLGSRVKEIAWDVEANSKLKCFSLKDEFIHFYGSHKELLEKHGLSQDIILNELDINC
jgi:transketolase